ncbi:MAG: phytoene desaturase family protein [Cytophagaceae bacterium]
MYKKFNPNDNFNDIDYVIVGSGIGGLTAAVFLAKDGKKVLVLERHFVPGGFTHTFKRKNGFVWDVGVHYVGNMDKEESHLRQIFDYLTDNQLDWKSMGEIYDEFHIGKDKYVFKAGKENLRKQLYDYFPDDKAAIDKYFKLIEKAIKYGGLYFVDKVFPPFLQHTVGKIFRMLFKPYYKRTTYDVLKTITDNEKLISVLCAQCGNYGLPPKKSSFGAHAFVINHFLEGGYYPVGGADQIYKTMLDVLQKNGGRVYVKAEVQDIVVEKGEVKGVNVSGTFIPCKHVISNAGAKNTFTKLLNASIGQKWASKLGEVKPSTCHLCLYIGLDKSDEALGLPKNNVWFYSDYNYQDLIELSMKDPNHQLEFAYISFPSAKDPNWSLNKEGTSTIQAIGVANYEWFREYENEPWMNRSDIYEEMKERFKEKMLAKLYELYPQIKGHVKVTEVSSPISTKHFMNYEEGEIYGLEHSPERFGLSSLRPVTPIKGLYLVGQDVVTVGVAGAMASGLLLSISLLKFGISKHFRKMREMAEEKKTKEMKKK